MSPVRPTAWAVAKGFPSKPYSTVAAHAHALALNELKSPPVIRGEWIEEEEQTNALVEWLEYENRKISEVKD